MAKSAASENESRKNAISIKANRHQPEMKAENNGNNMSKMKMKAALAMYEMA